jgi:hypothetical protein
MKKKTKDQIEQEYCDTVRAAEKVMEEEREAAVRKYRAAVDNALCKRLDSMKKHGYYRGC